MDEVYKSRQIRTSPQLNPDTDCWIPQADVSWKSVAQNTASTRRSAGPFQDYRSGRDLCAGDGEGVD